MYDFIIFLLDSTGLNPKLRLAADIPPGGKETRLALRLPPWKPHATLQRQGCPPGPACGPSPAWPPVHSSEPVTATRTQSRPLVNAAGGITTAAVINPITQMRKLRLRALKFTQLLSDGARFKPIGYPRWPGFRQAPSQLSGVGGHLDSPTLKVTSISDSPTHTLQRQSVDFSIQHPTPPDSPTHRTRAT